MLSNVEHEDACLLAIRFQGLNDIVQMALKKTKEPIHHRYRYIAKTYQRDVTVDSLSVANRPTNNNGERMEHRTSSSSHLRGWLPFDRLTVAGLLHTSTASQRPPGNCERQGAHPM